MTKKDNCTHDCSTCSSTTCSDKNTAVLEKEEPKSLLEKTHELSNVKRVFGVLSGKGGVGKSLVSGLLASLLAKRGYKTAILDADVTGPSIPKMFGIKGYVTGDDTGIYPRISEGGVSIISSNFLIENEDDPIVWRGPLIAGMVKQFWTKVVWNNIDYMFIDMPPGTGDVSLTVFQSIPLDGIIVVTSPQDLVNMIVKKAIKMAEMMDIPLIGVVENMSYIKCPNCDKDIRLFNPEKENKMPILDKIPLDHNIANSCDKGEIEKVEVPYLDNTIYKIMFNWPIPNNSDNK